MQLHRKSYCDDFQMAGRCAQGDATLVNDESDGADSWNMDGADDLDDITGFQRSVEGMRVRV